MDGEMLRKNLKAIYKDTKAPAGFSSRVMQRITAEAVRTRPSGISFGLMRRLRPAIAIAASFILITGIYLAGFGMPVLAPTEDLRTAETPLPDAQTAKEAPYVNGGRPLLIAEAEDLLDLPPVTVYPAAEDMPLAESARVEDVPDAVATVQTPVSDPPVDVRLVADTVDSNGDSAPPALREHKPAAANGYSHAVAADKPPVIAPLAEQDASFVLSEADIPHPSVFMSRRRVIESLSVNISVGTINNALRKLKERESLFGITADTEAADIRSDGTIIMMRSYIVPTSLANAFIAHINAVGSSGGIKRDRADITQEYNRMLDSHRDLMIDMARTGQGVREINEIAEELLFFDERAKDGVKNVVVWLEDGVDF